MTDRSVKSYDGRFRRRWRLAITLLVLGLVGAAITWQTERVTKSVALTELRLLLAKSVLRVRTLQPTFQDEV